MARGRDRSGLFASLADIDRALHAEVASALAPSDDEEVRRRQRDVQQIVALFEGRPNPAATPGPGRRHRAIAEAIRDVFERYGASVRTLPGASSDVPEPGTQPHPRPARRALRRSSRRF